MPVYFKGYGIFGTPLYKPLKWIDLFKQVVEIEIHCDKIAL